jgi:hypothetical protein
MYSGNRIPVVHEFCTEVPKLITAEKLSKCV